MDFETAQMVKITETENTGYVNGEGIVYGDDEKWESRPPPFLIKTFEIVDDPETNSFISWNSSGTGLIIWDHNKFSDQILPKIFKTNNFATFGFKKISWDRYEYANQWFQAGKKQWLKNIKRRSEVTKKRARFTNQNSMNATIESKLDAMKTEQNDMKREIQKLRENLDNMENQLTSLEIPRLPEFKDETINITDFLKQFMEYLRKEKPEASDDNAKRPRLEGPGSTELAVVPAENCQFWKKLMDDDDAGFDSNKDRGDLTDLHSKAMMEFDEMMASNIEMQREILIAKPSDAYEEDDGHLELWT
ncbi:hypothetical protein DH2020_042011 [Rehmannia glutinosa]|uniref:HSF-type DNA-binding domain-containing protein n=1 Tax=Rehmannia glutinosa TaxID=99300 RepID=A0ABR0UPP0_REHGL